MKKTVSGIAFAAALAFTCIAADAPAPSPHETIRRQLEALRAKPVKAELPPYLAPEEDFEDACRSAAEGGRRVVVSIGREACGRCQVFYEYVRRGELKIDGAEFALIRLDIDDASQRSYFLSTFTPQDNNLPFVGVMNGERDALAPCMSGGHTAAEYAKMLKDVVKGKDSVEPGDEMWSRPVALREGVTMRAFALEEPRLMKAYVVRVELSTPGIGFTASERDPLWGKMMPGTGKKKFIIATRRERTADFMMRRRAEGKNVEVAANTAPWRPWPPPKDNVYASLSKWNVSDGMEISHRRDPRSGAFFIIRKDGTADIASSVPASETNSIAFAMCGFDIIMTNGAPVMAEGAVGKVQPRRLRDLHPRMAFGLTADRKTLVLLAVDGRQPGYSLGADMSDICNILRREGVTDAVNMDGGGSASLVVYDRKTGRPRMLNHHQGWVQRANAVNFGITF